MLTTITLIIALVSWIAESAVLDPSLYLAPSPPLMLTSNSIPPEEMWGRSLEERAERPTRHVSENTEIVELTTEKPFTVEGRMFWPSFNSPQPVLGIHVPLTFSLSGSYGKVAAVPAGVIGNTYTSVAGLGTRISSAGSGLGSTLGSTLGSSLFGKSVGYGNYGRSALAGSSYGTYGTSAVRVYGSDNVASWSGWGNGKWGHYGKG